MNAAPLQVQSELQLRRWMGRLFQAAAFAGLLTFGVYILLRTTADWVANIGIVMHFFMGAVLVLAWLQLS
jgi:hypothetical protein